MGSGQPRFAQDDSAHKLHALPRWGYSAGMSTLCSSWRISALLRYFVCTFCSLTILCMMAANTYAQVDANASAPAVTIDADGTVHIPPQVVQLSSFLSPEARAYVTYRLLHPDPAPDPDIAKERARIDAHLAPLIDKQKARYPVEMRSEEHTSELQSPM